MSAVTESGPRTSGRKPAVLILWILAALFLLLAIMYLAVPAKDLPGFIGHVKNGGAELLAPIAGAPNPTRQERSSI